VSDSRHLASNANVSNDDGTMETSPVLIIVVGIVVCLMIGGVIIIYRRERARTLTPLDHLCSRRPAVGELKDTVIVGAQILPTSHLSNHALPHEHASPMSYEIEV
jgi:hypothetical protein